MMMMMMIMMMMRHPDPKAYWRFSADTPPPTLTEATLSVSSLLIGRAGRAPLSPLVTKEATPRPGCSVEVPNTVPYRFTYNTCEL
jgi:hypothetical protein